MLLVAVGVGVSPLPRSPISPMVDSADAAVVAQLAAAPASGLEAAVQASPSVRLILAGGSRASITEGERVELGVLLSEPVDRPVTVTVAIAGGTATFDDFEWCARPLRSRPRLAGCPSDTAESLEPGAYSQPSITFELLANWTIRPFDIFTFDDSVEESDETIVLEITSVSAGLSIDRQNATIRITVADNDAFSDTADHFASEHIETLADLNVFWGTNCTTDGEPGFCPNEPIPRWVMAVWTVRLIDRAEPRAVATSRFSDVDPSLWWSAHVERFAQLGITHGFGDGTFRPDTSVKRAHMAAFLARAYKLPFRGERGFADTVDSSHRYSIDRLAASGVTQGCGDGSVFCPDRATTRGEMAAFLVRASRWEESYRTRHQRVLDHIESLVPVSVQFDSAVYTATMSSPRVAVTVSLDRNPEREFTLGVEIDRLATAPWHIENYERPDVGAYQKLTFDEDSLSASFDIDVSDWFPEDYLPERALILHLGTSPLLPRVSLGTNRVAFVRVLEETDQPRPDQATQVAAQAESDLEESERIQAILAIPADRKADYSSEAIAQYERRIATVISEVQRWFRTQTDGRHPVFRREAFDISVKTVTLSKTVNELEGYSHQRLASVIRSEAGIAARTPILTVLDGRHGRWESSGWGSDDLGVVLIPMLNTANTWTGESEWLLRSVTYAHELGHLLGAVESCAPNEGDHMHVVDDRRDILSAHLSPRDWPNFVLDSGRDDYYRHGRSGCPDISDNRLLGVESLHLPTTPLLYPYTSSTHVIANWFPPDRQAQVSYDVEYRQHGDDEWHDVEAKFLGSEFAILPRLSECTKYEIRAAASSQLGTSKYSYAPTIELAIPRPSRPSLEFDPLSKSMTATWTVTADNHRNSGIQYRKQGEAWRNSEWQVSTRIARDGSLVNVQSISDLDWDAHYEIRVAELIEECSQVVHQVSSFVPRTITDS